MAFSTLYNSVFIIGFLKNQIKRHGNVSAPSYVRRSSAETAVSLLRETSYWQILRLSNLI